MRFDDIQESNIYQIKGIRYDLISQCKEKTSTHAYFTDIRSLKNNSLYHRDWYITNDDIDKNVFEITLIDSKNHPEYFL